MFSRLTWFLFQATQVLMEDADSATKQGAFDYHCIAHWKPAGGRKKKLLVARRRWEPGQLLDGANLVELLSADSRPRSKPGTC